jgi:hypothetical protein
VTIYAFFDRRERECEEAGVVPDGNYWNMVAEEVGGDGSRGRILGHFRFNARAYLQVHEVIVMSGMRGHRRRYAYFLVVDGEEVWGYERDPTHDPPVPRHDHNHQTYPCEPISFKEACARGWETLGELGCA